MEQDFINKIAMANNITEADAQVLYDIYGNNETLLTECTVYQNTTALGQAIVDSDERYRILPSGKIIFYDMDVAHW